MYDHVKTRGDILGTDFSLYGFFVFVLLSIFLFRITLSCHLGYACYD